MSALSFNLELPGQMKALARQIADDIDSYSEFAYNDGHRTHLGASIIGHDCARYLWSTFRWLKYERKVGRVARLLRRGHEEEPKFIELLRAIGFTIWDRDANGDQFRVVDCGGHFGGSSDSVGKVPPRYGNIPPMLLEFKTKGTGSGFDKLVKFGVALEQPMHYNQMCIYGFKYQLQYALYCSINKNDDAIHWEVIRLDWDLAQQLIAKAGEVISRQFAPAKISATPSYNTCKFCDFKSLCHEDAAPEKNCRSCINAVPIENAQWACKQFSIVLTKETIAVGCDSWKSII